MTRKSFLIAAGMLVILVGTVRRDWAGTPKVVTEEMRAARLRQRTAAIQMNAQAGQIHSLEDSRRVVDGIATEFRGELPAQWATRGFRDRIARAEYESASDSEKLIPEERVANAWNRYVQELGAAEEARVNVAEIHALRDQEYAVGKVLWNRMTQNVWTMPNIHAVGEDGKVADGCRALEAIRLLWDIDNIFRNLRGARARVQKGVLASDLIKQEQMQGSAQHRTTAVGHVESMTVYNPVEVAERRYLREHGVSGMSRAVEGLLNDLFPAKDKA